MSDAEPDLNPAQREVFDRLACPPADRPVFDSGLADGLRHDIESGLAHVVQDLTVDRWSLSKHRIESVLGCEVRFLAEDDAAFSWTAPMARGSVAHKAVELSITRPGRRAPLDLVDQAMASLAAGDSGLGDWLASAPEAEVDEVRALANASLVTFEECWPPLDRRWKPATEVPMSAELFGGRVVLRGRIDLSLGAASGNRAGKVIVDFKTGGPTAAHWADVRFYALIDTLRIGTPPRLIANYYLAAARLATEDVTEDVLGTAVRRTVDAATRLAELDSTPQDAVYRAGPSCRWCPLHDGCDAAAAYEDDEG